MAEPSTRAERRAATAARILQAAQMEFGDRGFGATVEAQRGHGGLQFLDRFGQPGAW